MPQGEIHPERQFDLAARERLLAALARLGPGLARVERQLESLETARLALLVHRLRSEGFDNPQSPIETSASPRIPDEIFEESVLSELCERAEDFIATCRSAIPADRQVDGGKA